MTLKTSGGTSFIEEDMMMDVGNALFPLTLYSLKGSMYAVSYLCQDVAQKTERDNIVMA